MKSSPFFIFLILLIFISCESQPSTEKGIYLTKDTIEIKPSSLFDHIKHIREKSRKRQIDKDDFGPEYFVDYVIESVLENSEHQKYITDRSLLRKLENKVCWDTYVLINDTLLNGDRCRIEIKTQAFSPENHRLKYRKGSNSLSEVDGKYPFGAVYAKYPKQELESLEITINDKKIPTKIAEYKNIYEPSLCNFGNYKRILEAYEDGENIYIYIFGGNAAGSYFAKLIFDRLGFVTSIIVDYRPLSEYGSFGEHFIGF